MWWYAKVICGVLLLFYGLPALAMYLEKDLMFTLGVIGSLGCIFLGVCFLNEAKNNKK